MQIFKFVLFYVVFYVGNLAAQAPTPSVNKNTYHTSTSRPGGQIDSIFPFDIALFTMDSVETNSREVLQNEGKPMLLAFWLSTCVPCRYELDAYAQKYAAWQKEVPFKIVVISIDFPNRFAAAAKLSKEKQHPFPYYWDKNREFKEILPGGLNGLPQVFLYDGMGKLVWQHKRFWSGVEDEMFEAVKKASQ